MTNKILIITDSVIGERMIERLIETYSKDNQYYIIQTREHRYEKAGPDRFKFFTFDPTSLSKLENVLKLGFVQVMLVMAGRADTMHTIENIRMIKPELRIVLFDQWGLELDDRNMLHVDTTDLLSARLIDYLPSVPVIAQNVGLGEGEIMEVLLPFGSAYVYRYVSAVEQPGWRIAAIYRERRLILPKPSTLLHPNDLLLLIGEPSVLITIYRAIKRELGQFPAPYGSTLYLYIDMRRDRHDDIMVLVRKTRLLQQQIRRRLVIRIANPGDLGILAEIKVMASQEISVVIDYDRHTMAYLIDNDKRHYHVGMIIVSRRLFAAGHNRRILYDARVPVFKMSAKSLKGVIKASVLVTETDALMKISTTIFDIAAQMEWRLELIHYTQIENSFKTRTDDYFRNLATIFSRSMQIIESEENPIRQLKNDSRYVHCLPFDEDVVRRSLFSWFSTDPQSLSFHLDDAHQLFIPL